jgi:hypothetical protein
VLSIDVYVPVRAEEFALETVMIALSVEPAAVDEDEPGHVELDVVDALSVDGCDVIFKRPDNKPSHDGEAEAWPGAVNTPKLNNEDESVVGDEQDDVLVERPVHVSDCIEATMFDELS